MMNSLLTRVTVSQWSSLSRCIALKQHCMFIVLCWDQLADPYWNVLEPSNALWSLWSGWGCTVSDIMIIWALPLQSLLVFSKCFRAGFWAFSELKYTVKGVTNSCNHDRSQTLKSDEAKWSKLTKITPVAIGSFFFVRNTHDFEKIRWGSGLVCLSSSYGYGNLWALIKVNTYMYLIFISGVVVHAVCHYWLLDF